MRCSVCGAKLKKEGDICSNCYKEFKEEEKLQNDNNVLYKVKRKYLPKYQLTQYIDLYVVFSLSILLLAGEKKFLEIILCLAIFIVLLGVFLAFNKLKSKGTTYTFYETKIKYDYKFLIFKSEKTIKISDISEILYYQTKRQKMFNLGDIRIYTKGNFLMNGIEMKNIAEVEEVFVKLKEILNLEEK